MITCVYCGADADTVDHLRPQIQRSWQEIKDANRRLNQLALSTGTLQEPDTVFACRHCNSCVNDSTHRRISKRTRRVARILWGQLKASLESGGPTDPELIRRLEYALFRVTEPAPPARCGAAGTAPSAGRVTGAGRPLGPLERASQGCGGAGQAAGPTATAEGAAEARWLKFTSLRRDEGFPLGRVVTIRKPRKRRKSK